ncbi:hypothetical protein EUGRSUZ_B01282 [Eucalyptus grandis]|uniref:Disease resistance protein winged helix domain-containing protein n=2 Tax=Eucalyptus grandis TaxID=71139 RepID=A0A059D1J9_EUCGR|nr:hypothetical protein EUGRSUZ_B01282 [Eucalyptus grandis]
MGGAKGSKILITTRLPLVAKITYPTLPLLLEGLSKSNSLDLLMRMAVQKEGGIQDLDMRAIGEEIVRKCFGVPLVIRTIGGLLFQKETKDEWLRFKDVELPKVSQLEDPIISILRLSYDHLPSHLKQCFTICSLFPKDYEIKKHTLVDLWMAEGFIHPSNSVDVSACERCERLPPLDQLPHLKSLYIEDLPKLKYIESDKSSLHHKVCNIYRASWISVSGIVRSWIYPKTKAATSWISILHNLRSVTISELPKLTSLPQWLLQARNLECLTICGCRNLKAIPEQIEALQSLQHLDIGSWCSSLTSFPEAMRRLTSLTHLRIYDCKEFGESTIAKNWRRGVKDKQASTGTRSLISRT